MQKHFNKGGIMDEVYTCICGNQKWIIAEQSIRCSKCHTVYGGRDLFLQCISGIDDCRMLSPKEFNKEFRTTKEDK